MAYASKPKANKKGGYTFTLFACLGYNNGEQVRQTKTWKSPPGMSENKAKKEAQKEADKFEETLKYGYIIDTKTTLTAFIDIWQRDHADVHLKDTTSESYGYMISRIKQKLGYIKLTELQPHHIIEFVKWVTESDELKNYQYKLSINYTELLGEKSQAAFAAEAHISRSTLGRLKKGEAISRECALKIAAVKNKSLTNIFEAIEQKQREDTTIRKYYAILSSILNKAVKWGYLMQNPCSRVDAPKVRQNKSVKALTKNELDELAKAINNENILYRTLFFLALSIGARRGELCALTWNDVDMENGKITINKGLVETKNGIKEDTTKNYRARTVPVPPQMIQYLRRWKCTQAIWKECSRNWIPTERVFTSKRGGNLRPSYVTKRFAGMVEKNGLPKWLHTHILRHEHASIAAAAGTPMIVIADLLGHADPVITGRFYTHAKEEAEQRAIEAVNNALEGYLDL